MSAERGEMRDNVARAMARALTRIGRPMRLRATDLYAMANAALDTVYPDLADAEEHPTLRAALAQAGVVDLDWSREPRNVVDADRSYVRIGLHMVVRHKIFVTGDYLPFDLLPGDAVTVLSILPDSDRLWVDIGEHHPTGLRRVYVPAAALGRA